MMKLKDRVRSRRVAVYGLMIALALIFSYVEARIPNFFAFPGMKLGITNIVVLMALYKMGNVPALLINFLRIGLVAMLFGGVYSFAYSFVGGMLSCVVMILLKQLAGLRPVTVSIAGGVAHNIGQIVTAMVLMNTAGIGWYLCVLWFTGMFSGTLIGFLGYELNRRLPDRLFEGGKKK